MMYQKKPVRLLVMICIASVISMLSFALWPVFLLNLGDQWGLSNTQIGWIGGGYFVGYVIATPLLVGGTDRIDARIIYIFGCLSSALGCLGFALFADGFWSAFIAWAFVGAGLAGTFMPGLQIVNARLSPEFRVRAVPFYTSCFGFGSGGSFLAMGFFLTQSTHVMAAFVGAAAAVISGVMIFLFVEPVAPAVQDGGKKRHPLDLRPAFRKPLARGYIAAYGAHTFELFAYRNWSFALFIFVGAQASPALTPTLVSVIVSLLTVTGMLSSIFGAKLCLSYGRHRVITLIGAAGALMAVASAYTLDGPVWLAIGILWLFNIVIMLDSGALTAGTVEASDAHDRGALLAVHTLVGFGGGALGGPVVGYMLDLGGGANSMDAWFGAVMVMGLGSVVVAIIQWRFWRAGPTVK